jgi:ribonucleoside-triphosphate reductase
VCNLTTINVTQFIKSINGKYVLDLEGLLEAQRLSARIGLRMTLVDLELPHWSKTQQRDRLIGTSLTGWQDMISILNMSDEEEKQVMKQLKEASRDEAESYAKQLRIPVPLLATTVKPEGTLSQVARNPITDSPVSSGLHMSHAPFFIRRVRINSNDPLVQVAKELGWVIHAEVGTNELYTVEELAKPEVIESARTLVIDFPVKSGAIKTKDDVSVKEQFDTYFKFQKYYTEHNSSNTITVKPHEWDEAEQIVWDNWDDFVGVSFLAHDGGTYTLAPYETITEVEYEERKSKMKPFDPTLLRKYEQSETSADLENMEACESGVCPIR